MQTTSKSTEHAHVEGAISITSVNVRRHCFNNCWSSNYI